MMVYTGDLSQPSIFELARAGDFQAIAYWINRELTPQGIYARVEKGASGYLQILVEFQKEPPADRLIKFICNRVGKLNSPTVKGVKIMARFVGSPHILWKQSVRIVTPASQERKKTPRSRNQSQDWVTFQIFRSLLLMGSAMTAFILGCWVSYHEVLVRRAASAETVQTALETVEVVYHDRVVNPHDPTVTLMFAGDVNLSNAFSEVVGENYHRALLNMKEYREADLAMVNLENPLTRSTQVRTGKQFNYKADPKYVKVLTEGGVDLVNLANDRVMDYEEPGLVETIETLDEAGIHYVGGGKNIQEARKPEIIEVKGQRIAYLGYYDSDITAAGVGVAGINARNNDRIAADIRALRDQVDWIIVNYHWGVELSDYPGDWQIDLARFTIDQGADLVVGHHPHVLQGAEIYQGRPIIYSLGNFIFGGNSRSDYDTAVLKVSLKEGKMKVEFLPVEVKNYQPQVVTGEKGSEILRHIGRISSIFEKPMRSPVVLEMENSSVRTSKNSGEDGGAARSDRQPTLPQFPQNPQIPVEENREWGVVNGVEKANDRYPENLPISHTQFEEKKAGVADSKPIMPPLLNPKATANEEKETFLKQPFIKEPFIETPLLEIQSSLPENDRTAADGFSPSFELSDSTPRDGELVSTANT